MSIVAGKPEVIKDVRSHYCPGCGHGILHRLVAECIEELDLQETFLGIAPVGCSVLMYDYLNVDYIEVAHGRAPAVATGLKKAHPDHFVLSYQGDGDLASIGMAEIIHAAHRGFPITVLFVNNAIYGMTGGQMAPTTLIGQKSTTTPLGRNPEVDGFPVRVCELLSSIEGTVYLERVKVNTPKDIRQAKKALLKAFQNQLDKKGFSLVEALAMCPTNWHKNVFDSLAYVDTMAEVYPLGVYKDV
ncbi:thiamine pyrophosphate-dependent enzyme [Planctomycetota bacterium]